jgi:hypothetical protein
MKKKIYFYTIKIYLIYFIKQPNTYTNNKENTKIYQQILATKKEFFVVQVSQIKKRSKLFLFRKAIKEYFCLF